MATDKMPPRFFIRFFRWYCQPKLVDHIEGDLLEDYGARLKRSGKRQADIRFIVDVLLLFRPGIIRSGKKHTASLNQYDMLANYIKIAIRILRRNKGYSFINISGLAVGLAAAMLILLWVQNEISYDRFHSKAGRIYKLFSRDHFNGRTDVWQNTPSVMAPELKASYPEVEDDTRFRVVFFLVKAGEQRFNERGAFVDPSFLTMFDFPMQQGDRNALSNDFGIVLSEPMAIKLFGKTDCVGKTVVVNDTDSFTVTGVLKALSHTDFQFEYLVPWAYYVRLGWDTYSDWTQTNTNNFVLLKEGTSPEAFQSKVLKIVQKHAPTGDGSTREVLAQPLAKVHLYTRAENGELVKGRIETVQLFSAIAILIILIACINFMNLSTARSEKRAQEVGVRKVVGAQKGALILQFISESTVLVFIAFMIALVLVQLSLSLFERIVGAPLEIDFSDPHHWLFAAALILLTGLLAGSYPAFYLSSSRPLRVLKGVFKNGHALITPRKALVVLQFTFAIVLSICAIMVQRQINFAMSRDAGYERGGVVYNFLQGEVPRHIESIRNELVKSGAAVSVTRTFSPVTYIWDANNGYSWPGSTEEDKTSKIFLQFGSDVDLVKTFGVTIKQGRDIDIYTYPSDTAAMLLNEKAVEIMALKDPIGETIKNENGQSFHVVGVVKDFIVGSPYQDVQPMMIKGWTEHYGAVHFRLNPSISQKEALQRAETVFKKYNPEYPFEYFFADDYYDRKFAGERQTATLAGLFAALAIFISFLGLFGLTAHMAENRTKEIGIRKVLGASTLGITTLISKEFLQLVIVSIVVASPVAFYVVSHWLQAFNYRVAIGVSVFLITAGVAILIAVATVSFQAIKAAMANPVKSLRSE